MTDDAHMITISELSDAKARIEELEATILKMGENTAEQAKYYQARIEELEAAIRDISQRAEGVIERALKGTDDGD